MKTVFYIGKMDCPTEEGIIRNRLKNIRGIEQLDFDLMSRKLTVIHDHTDGSTVQSALESVGMDPRELIEGERDEEGHGPAVPVRDRWIMGISSVLTLAVELRLKFDRARGISQR